MFNLLVTGDRIMDGAGKKLQEKDVFENTVAVVRELYGKETFCNRIKAEQIVIDIDVEQGCTKSVMLEYGKFVVSRDSKDVNGNYVKHDILKDPQSFEQFVFVEKFYEYMDCKINDLTEYEISLREYESLLKFSQITANLNYKMFPALMEFFKKDCLNTFRSVLNKEQAKILNMRLGELLMEYQP
ncbi:MAG: hypothetical protein HQL98_05110 [Magnetococcales bacterium]|nr:hypothetical protein [Magnetococcales bacterium]